MEGRRNAAVVTAIGAVVTALALGAPRPHDIGAAQALDDWMGLRRVSQLGGLASAVLVDRSTLYLTMSGRLIVFDVAIPSRPSPIAETLPFALAPKELSLVEGVLYVTDPPWGVRMVDVSDPEQPTVLAGVELAGVRSVAVRRGLLYAALGDDGLHIVDVSDPRHPSVRAQIATRLVARAVTVAGDYAYVAERDPWETGVEVVDIRDARRPQAGAFVHTPGGADYITVVGNLAYVLGSGGHLWTLRLTDPANPERWGGRPIVASGTSQAPATGTAYGIVVAGDMAYVPFGRRGVAVVDVQFGGRPRPVTVVGTPGDARSLALRGRSPYAFVADWDHGMRVLDLRDPVAPRELALYDTPREVVDAAIGDGYLCLADERVGLWLAHAGDPARPKLGGMLDTAGARVRGVAAVGGAPNDPLRYCVVAEYPSYRYVPTGRPGYVKRMIGGLSVVGAENLEAPKSIGQVDGASLTSVVAIEDYIFATSELLDRLPPPVNPVPESGLIDGLLAFDFSSAAAPQLVGYAELPRPPADLALDADRRLAYVAAGEAGLQVVDVADPAAPTVLTAISDTLATGKAVAVASSGGHAYLAVDSVGVQVYDVAVPRRPVLAAQVPLTDQAVDLALTTSYLLVGARSGVHLLDVADPAHPLWQDFYSIPAGGEVLSVSAGDGLVYVGVRPAEVIVLEIVPRPRPTPSLPATALPSATATATFTAVPSPVASPTPRPGPVYLPRLTQSRG